MKKLAIFILFILLTMPTIAKSSYPLGKIMTRTGEVEATYNEGKREHIKLWIEKENVGLKIYVPKDLKEIRKYIAKFEKWHKTAVENKSVLNKDIGKLSTFTVAFITVNNKYEIAFVETRTGLRIMTFSLNAIKRFTQIISDANIDNVLNAEKRRKAREDELFQ